ncbi:class I SAM-dependent methyltransferase [Candidatus Woesearchaeota archaeon]|nr:class I SAM-dependent methyltransferase [Candidatus Woesearchaeota archaeon]
MKEIWDNRHRKSIGRYNRITEFANFCFLNYLKGKQGKLLDLACGKGADSVFLHENGFTVTAIDYSSEAINQFNYIQRKKGVFITSLVRDIQEKLPFETDSFDYVFSRIGLGYFDDKTTKKIFSEIKRVLKSEGLLMFQVKSVNDRVYGSGKELEKDVYELSGYIRHFFSEDYARKLLKDFNIIYLEEKKLDNGNAYLDVIAEKK